LCFGAVEDGVLITFDGMLQVTRDAFIAFIFEFFHFVDARFSRVSCRRLIFRQILHQLVNAVFFLLIGWFVILNLKVRLQRFFSNNLTEVRDFALKKEN